MICVGNKQFVVIIHVVPSPKLIHLAIWDYEGFYTLYANRIAIVIAVRHIVMMEKSQWRLAAIAPHGPFVRTDKKKVRSQGFDYVFLIPVDKTDSGDSREKRLYAIGFQDLPRLLFSTVCHTH